MKIEKFIQLARLTARHPNRTGKLLNVIQEGERERIAIIREQNEYEKSQKGFLEALKDLLFTQNLQIPTKPEEELELCTSLNTHNTRNIYRKVGDEIRITAERLADNSIYIHNSHTFINGTSSDLSRVTFHLDADMTHVLGIVHNYPVDKGKFTSFQEPPAITNQISALTSTKIHLQNAKVNRHIQLIT